MRLLFEGSGLLLGSLAVLLLFVATLALALYRDEFRDGGGKLAYVSRFGPLRVLTEYELVRIARVRTGSASPMGLTNICLDYDGATALFGRALPPAALGKGLEFIRLARESVAGELAAQILPVELTEPSDTRMTIGGRSGRLPPFFLICANLVPLAGVLLFDWDLAQIMVLFWAENAVVGIYAVLKLAVIQRWGVLLTGPLFIGHFGGFMAIHFLVVYHLFVRGIAAKDPEPAAATALAALFAPLWSAVMAMLVSHGVSFFSNFIGRREYLGRTGIRQMAEPYRRVGLLHVTLILGGFAVMALGQPIYALLVLVVLKITIDLRAHLRERRAAY